LLHDWANIGVRTQDSAGCIALLSVVQNLQRHGKNSSFNFFHFFYLFFRAGKPIVFRRFPWFSTVALCPVWSSQVLTMIFALSLTALAAGEEISWFLAMPLEHDSQMENVGRGHFMFEL
jgi:hypothetical protein